jgi:hypothetical protein
LSPLYFAMLGDIDLIFGIWVYNDELKKGETFASLLNIHGGDIRVVTRHLVLYSDILSFDIHFINLFFH